MNERINLLEDQCYEYKAEMPDIWFNKEKFAELIVRECAKLTLDYKSETYYNGWLDYRDEIKKHFGVDE